MGAKYEFEAEVEQRLRRPFERVREQLEEMFDEELDEVLVIIETAATKSNRTHAQVIVDLIERSERKPSAQTRVKRSVIRWIGKPWRERENPWDKFKDRVPPVPPPTDTRSADLDEWTPLKPDDD
jgi:anti-sigma factor ChrR (cupin superfamily)